MPPALSPEQKRELYRSGYVVLRGAVPRELTHAARRALFQQMVHPEGREPEGTKARLLALINSPRSGVRSALRDAIGEYDEPASCDAKVRPPSDPGKPMPAKGARGFGFQPESDGAFPRLHISGVPYARAPFHGWHPHIDGLWYRHPPGDAAKARDVAAYLGDPTARGVPGTNGAPRFQDAARTLSLDTFTAFVGVCLSDQSEEGSGNLGVLPGSHHEMEAFFRWQRAQGGVMGPEGPSWPRLKHTPGKDGLFGLAQVPPPVLKKYTDLPGAPTVDGVQFARPDWVRMREGDAVITLYSLCHDGSVNALGAEPKMTAYYRITKDQRGKRRRGLDAFKDCMCDVWRDWEGMRDTVAAERRSAKL